MLRELQRQVIDIVVRERRARLGGRNILLRGSRLRNIAGGVVDRSLWIAPITSAASRAWQLSAVRMGS